MTAVTPASAAVMSPSANGKNASDATTAPTVNGCVKTLRFGGFGRFPDGDAGRIDPAHLAGADADGGAPFRIHDGVRLDVLRDLEREPHVVESRHRDGARFVTTFKSRSSALLASRDWTRKPPATDLTCRPGARESASPPVSKSRKFFLRREDRLGFVRCAGGDDDLGEDLGDLLRRALVDRLIERDDAAEGADRIATRAP